MMPIRSRWTLFILSLLLVLPPLRADEVWDPVADPKAIVLAGAARFTILTPQLLRMEWSADGQFEDHASLVFVNRRLPVPEFISVYENGWLVVRTPRLTLRYRPSAGRFTRKNLRVEMELNGKTVVWMPGMEDKANLQGTIRTLDGVKGAASLDAGLISRNGWAVVDDSGRPLLDNSEWPWVMARPSGKRQDLYLFAYGHEYTRALHDYTRVAGRIPLPPRYIFGAWWSRYWAYTDSELEELVRAFRERDIPLDVLVIDMDWHPTFGVKWWENKRDQAGQQLGWTGYTWNRTYFPDPPKFLERAHRQGLKTTLNMHPASGVQPHEDAYAAMARAMGIDPATRRYVPFDITNKKFAENYFKILHHPLERQGIDFFWLDWQQQQTTSIAGVNPTWWLNYTHFTDMERRGLRPLLFHRWGGLGNHRYQIGFSGDTVAVWDSLAFQPYFTATAANVGYGYWSHDIGGHMRAALGAKPAERLPQDPDYAELYTRWIQWGVFSPVLRTHTTKDPESERRIWAYPLPYADAMRDSYLLRYALIPYIYTAARNAYDSGISLCHPPYYEYPEAEEAYAFKDQYFFGSDMLVAPVTAPASRATGLATKTIWLPPGTWIEWFSGTTLTGPRQIERTFRVGEIPVYVRAGAIVPMQPKMQRSDAKPLDPLILTLFPGSSGATRVYEDAGNTLGYKNEEFAWTTVRQTLPDAGMRRIEIGPAEGHYPGMIRARGYEIRLLGALPPVAVTVNGTVWPYAAEEEDPGWSYNGSALAVIVRVPKMAVHQKLEVLVTLPPAPATLTEGIPGILARLRAAMDTLHGTWPRGWSPELLIEAAQTGRRLTLNPADARQELEKLQRSMPALIEAVNAMEVDCAFKVQALSQIGHAPACAPQAR